MKRSKFTDEQILAIVREGEAGRKVADWFARRHGIVASHKRVHRVYPKRGCRRALSAQAPQPRRSRATAGAQQSPRAWSMDSWPTRGRTGVPRFKSGGASNLR